MSNKPEHLNHTAKTREELARELGMSYSTLWRRIRETGRRYPRRLLSPREVEEIKSALGFSPPPPEYDNTETEA